MRLHKLTPSVHELFVQGYCILFSYETPVAYHHGGKFYRTNKRWSKITLKQITMWFNSHGVEANDVIEVDQETFDTLFFIGEEHGKEKKQTKPKKSDTSSKGTKKRN